MDDITAEEEYIRNPDLKKEHVTALIEWAKSQPHLPPMSELLAINFLHSNYFDLMKAKKTAECYFTYRAKMTELFSNLNMEAAEIQQTHEILTISCLPQTTPEGYRVIYVKLLNADPSLMHFSNNIKLSFMFMECLIRQKGTCPGYIFLNDMENIRFGHFFKISVFTVKHYISFVQEALPIRLKLVEHINIPWFINKLVGIFHPFMNKELLDLLKYRKQIEDTYETIPPEVFPNDYKFGTAPSIMELHELSWNFMFSRKECIKHGEKLLRSDESKRETSHKEVLSQIK